MAIRVASKPVGSEQLAARVQIAVRDEVLASALVKARWSNDDALTARINPEVAHYTGQTELASAIQDGLAAKAAGDAATATVKLGRAVQLAAETGNEEATAKLRKVVEIDDENEGHRAAEARRREARRDGARHRLDQDHAGAQVSPSAPTATRRSRPTTATSAERPWRPPPLRPQRLPLRPRRRRRFGSGSGPGEPITCPNCSFPNLPDALFCENCGYDFTTGSLPEPDPELRVSPAPLTAPAPVPNAPAVVPVVAPGVESRHRGGRRRQARGEH